MDQLIPPTRWYRRRRHQSTLGVITALIIAVITILAAHPQYLRQIQAVQPGMWTVVRDIDGDTIVVQQGSDQETVRFIGVDTPETHKPNTPVQCYGPEAAAFTKAQVSGQAVKLAPDPKDTNRDKYGRLLRYVYLADGTLLNARLIQDGYGFAYVIFPFEKLSDFSQLQSQAKVAGRGLWSACGIDDSSDIFQTTIKSVP